MIDGYILDNHKSGGWHNGGDLLETHRELKYHQILLAHNLFFSCPIILKFWTEHGSDTAMLCTKFQNDWGTEMDVMEE